jgi:hypothetical protein
VSSHELVEKTAGLASRVDNLVLQQTGEECRELERQQARLEKLTLAAIVTALDESARTYKEAIAALDGAIDAVGEGEERIERISRIIKLVARAADVVEGALKKAGGLPSF